MFSGTAHYLADVFRVLRTSGFKLSGNRPKAKESQWSGRFINPATEASIWIHFTSTICTIKQIRTEMKEVPVYETVCDEGTSSEDNTELQQDDNDDDIPL